MVDHTTRSLSAVFNTDIKVVQHALSEMDKRTGDTTIVTITDESETSSLVPLTRATGPAQDIMFLIGEIAAHGENGLIRVTSR
jgi:Trk K+ transport system NAD-binding subunit